MLQNYTLLTGLIKSKFVTKETEYGIHYMFIIRGDDGANRLGVVNVSGQNIDEGMKLFVIPNFDKLPIWSKVIGRGSGLINLKGGSGEGCLDYVRTPILTMDEIKNKEIISTNDLISALKKVAAVGTRIWIFGEFFSDTPKHYLNSIPEEFMCSKLPQNGIHDSHLNQGQFAQSPTLDINGIYQDGALVFETPDGIVAYLIAFKDQTFPTDDNGHPIKQ